MRIRIKAEILILIALIVVFFISIRDGILEGTTGEKADLKRLNKALFLIKKEYFQPFDTPEKNEKLIIGAINGMLDTLDPHTNYLDKSAFKYMKEEQEGLFYGIGITFNIRDDQVQVIAPIEGTPAYKLGIRAGDRIVKIEGESTKGITTEQVIQKLRGKKGTKVRVTIAREGVSELLEFEIIRDEIPLHSIPYSFMLNEEIGYIYISNFSSTTGAELDEKIEKLKAQGMKKLLLDLRTNPGGLLTAAREVADRFLEPGKLIVYTKGRIKGADMKLWSEMEDSIAGMPLVVLVNQGSASASEIVAGAIQDHDRGIIAGKETYGKGLVQRLYPMKNDETALQVTTAKYYTPSGRCIQKPFEDPRYLISVGMDERKVEKKTEAGDLNSTIFYTDARRRVYGSGGIKPDVEIEYKPEPPIIDKLRNRSAFFDFAIHYININKNIPKHFVVNEQILQSFKEFLAKKEIKYSEEEFQQAEPQIQKWIAKEIIATAYNAEEGYKILIKDESQVQEALKLFPEAEKLLEKHYAVIRN